MNLAARGLAGLLEIFEGALLGAHHRVAHGEVLAPAGEGVIRAAEGDVGDVARELHAEGAELLARLVVQVLHIMEELGLGEAPRSRHLLENLRREGRDEPTGSAAVLRALVLLGEALAGRPHAHAGALAGHDAVEVQVGELAKHEAVHLVERVLLKREVPSPVEVIKYVAHARLLRLWGAPTRVLSCSIYRPYCTHATLSVSAVRAMRGAHSPGCLAGTRQGRLSGRLFSALRDGEVP